MNRFVTFCIGIGIALLVLAVISNTSYAATTTETADGDPTMTAGTSSGTYTNTWSDDGTTQDLLEAKVGNKYYLDCYYNLSTAIDESRISAFEIGVNAWYTKPQGGQDDSYTVYVWDYGTSSWDSTTITVTATSDGTTYTDTITMGTEHIRDSDGNIAIRFKDNVGTNRANTLHIDYLYVKLTYTTISDVDTDKTSYSVGENIVVSWTAADGFGADEDFINVDYRWWNTTSEEWEHFCLHSNSNPANGAGSDTYENIPSSLAGKQLGIFVYTASDSGHFYTSAITEGSPWPYAGASVQQAPEFAIIAIPLISAIAIYFLMRKKIKVVR